MSGVSDAGGFFLFGDAPADAVEKAAMDALHRLQRGQHQLAIHPNCGTNLVTTGYLTSMVGILSTRGMQRRWDIVKRVPAMMLAMITAVIISQPIGYWLQKNVTTDGKPGNTEVVSVSRQQMQALGRTIVIHRVSTRVS